MAAAAGGKLRRLDDDWFVQWGGKEVGPFTANEMEANASGGALAPDDSVRQRGRDWTPAKDVPFLADHLRRRAKRARRTEEAGPVGIGGWLALPAIGLVVAPLINAWNILAEFALLDQAEVGEAEFRAVLAEEMVLNAVLLLFQVYVAVAFFRRKRAAPGLMIALILAGVGVNSIDTLMVESVPGLRPDFAQVVRSVIAAMVWIPYFLRSRRVKATFTY